METSLLFPAPAQCCDGRDMVLVHGTLAHQHSPVRGSMIRYLPCRCMADSHKEYVGISGNTSATHWAAIAILLPNVSPHTTAPIERALSGTLHPIVALADGLDILTTEGYSANIIYMIVEGTNL